MEISSKIIKNSGKNSEIFYIFSAFSEKVKAKAWRYK
jgi:hypothetical protein